MKFPSYKFSHALVKDDVPRSGEYTIDIREVIPAKEWERQKNVAAQVKIDFHAKGVPTKQMFLVLDDYDAEHLWDELGKVIKEHGGPQTL